MKKESNDNIFMDDPNSDNKKVTYDARLAYTRIIYDTLNDVKQAQLHQNEEIWVNTLKGMYGPVHIYCDDKINDKCLKLLNEIDKDLFSPSTSLALNQSQKKRRILKLLFECTNLLYQMAKPILLPTGSTEDDDFFTDEGFIRSST